MTSLLDLGPKRHMVEVGGQGGQPCSEFNELLI